MHTDDPIPAGGGARGLGRLLEIAIPVEHPAEALSAFAALGLRGLPVNDLEAAPRAVVSDGLLSIGLHDPTFDGPAPVFVRPDLRDHVAALEAAGADLEQADLADDRFHRVRFRDPSGLEIVLIEARTFPPAVDDPGIVSACGSFDELSVATHSLEESTSFWRALGFDVVEEASAPHPRRRLSGFGLSLGLHEVGGFRAALTFRAAQLDARIEYLRAKGFAPRRSSPLASGASATLLAPGGVPFYLLEADERDDEETDEEA